MFGKIFVKQSDINVKNRRIKGYFFVFILSIRENKGNQQ